jgi:hypothetical protein
MITETETKQVEQKGIPIERFKKQLENFREGFPSLDVQRPATIGDGLLQLSDEEVVEKIDVFEKALKEKSAVKFVPASGAATRMFKFLFEFSKKYKDFEGDIESVINKEENLNKFFSNIKDFPFYDELVAVLKRDGYSVGKLIENKKYVLLADYVLKDKGLNYGSLPKALLRFHKYSDHSRTALEEHLVEGALYSKYYNNTVDVHFTVSAEHRAGFESYVKSIVKRYEKNYKVKYNITYSEQNPSTDTIAVDLNNNPYRRSNGDLLFRPGGHGALLKNMNDLDEDIIFIKNIDNIVPDRLKDSTVLYKKVLGGLLVSYIEKIHEYLVRLENPRNITDELLDEILEFTKNELNTLPPDDLDMKDKNMLVNYLFKKLNRPVRVGGMVKSMGDTGGAPYWTRNPDGTIALQVAETKQIDLEEPEKKAIFENMTHFNPSDFACYIKDFKGNKFNLNKFIDPNTGFITIKSVEGEDIKALELPGLWNGGMSEWNSIFIDVPYETFNPVKTVNDLLEGTHRT